MSIGTGDRILVFAEDNVQVTNVRITISDDQGQNLEQGEAALVNNTWWEYATSAPVGVKVTVEALDPVGNVTQNTIDA